MNNIVFFFLFLIKFSLSKTYSTKGDILFHPEFFSEGGFFSVYKLWFSQNLNLIENLLLVYMNNQMMDKSSSEPLVSKAISEIKINLLNLLMRLHCLQILSSVINSTISTCIDKYCESVHLESLAPILVPLPFLM